MLAKRPLCEVGDEKYLRRFCVFCHSNLFAHQLLVSSLLCDFTILHKNHLWIVEIELHVHSVFETYSVALAQKLEAVSHQKHSLVLQHHLRRLHR